MDQAKSMQYLKIICIPGLPGDFILVLARADKGWAVKRVRPSKKV